MIRDLTIGLWPFWTLVGCLAMLAVQVWALCRAGALGEHGDVLGLGDGREWLCPEGHEVERPERLSVVPSTSYEGAVSALQGLAQLFEDRERAGLMHREDEAWRLVSSALRAVGGQKEPLKARTTDQLAAIIHDWTCGCAKGHACPARDGCREAAEQIAAAQTEVRR